MTTTAAPRAPKELGAAGRTLWRAIWSDLPDDQELSERERALLRLACRQLDRWAELEAKVDETGLTATGSQGQMRPNPLIAEARAAALAAEKLLNSLALPDGDDAVPRTAAQVRASRAADARYRRRRT